ncbi:hypothetical protein HNY73_007851 [Argiope bruennichi]|uniref:Uncharacterized protein n=1 Tax=Argiope bruennichi TaxID=94029 RepID=A0A8T0F4L1_ARGBR|nr:hypothetical protein HNY73_007851 [Argiope bruennichi]
MYRTFPYKIQTLQFIPDTANAQRRDSVNGKLVHKEKCFSDDACLVRGTNRQKYRFWGSPTLLVYVRHPQKVTVLCGSDPNHYPVALPWPLYSPAMLFQYLESYKRFALQEEAG